MRLDRSSLSLLLACAMGLGPVAPTLAKDAPQAKQRPLITQSHVIAPRTIGAFRLKETRYKPEQKAAGAMFRYAAIPEPELSADVFVYPAGRLPQAEAVKRGMADFHASLQSASEAGFFHNLKLVDEQPFPLKPGAAGKSDNPLEAVVAAAEPVGRRIDMTLEVGDARMPLRSRGYLFHKNLYFYKVRVSVPAAAMDAQAFGEFADHAARTLAERVDTINIGGCGDDPVYVDKKADGDAAALALITQVVQRNQENCRSKINNTELAKLTKGAETVTIKYSANDWGGR